MADLSQIKEHMEIVGADGVHLGTVDHVDGDRIRLVKADSGPHGGHHHYLSGGFVASVEGTSSDCLVTPRTLLCWRKNRTARR